jgi:glycosyltransferase involved in cell wall biosynthesis
VTQPLVSVSIPTLNSARTLELCLDSVARQTYKDLEINIIDGDSDDETIEIAEHHGVPIFRYSGALLGARSEGLRQARGEYVLLLDSDQVLCPDAIERAVRMSQERRLSMLVLEESVYRKDRILEKLFELDRRLVHESRDFDPFTSVMLPRFYKSELLRRAFMSVPDEALREIGGQDHAIIYYEAWMIDKSVDMLPGAVVKHIEPDSFKLMWRKFYRWGKTSKTARDDDRYAELLKRKERFRKGSFGRKNYRLSLASFTLLLIKGVPYKVGAVVGRIEGRRAKGGVRSSG